MEIACILLIMLAGCGAEHDALPARADRPAPAREAPVALSWFPLARPRAERIRKGRSEPQRERRGRGGGSFANLLVPRLTIVGKQIPYADMPFASRSFLITRMVEFRHDPGRCACLPLIVTPVEALHRGPNLHSRSPESAWLSSYIRQPLSSWNPSHRPSLALQLMRSRSPPHST